MTTEQKAKRYEEALKWMKELYPGLHGATKEDAEHYFPELKESEDERIIMELCAIVRDMPYMETELRAHGFTVEEILAWLEKQGEQKSKDKSKEKRKYDRMKPIYDARESFESALEKAWNDYHNGYENVDKLEPDYVECAYAKGFREGYLFGIKKQKEQKPAEWSEEDKENLNMVLDMVKYCSVVPPENVPSSTGHLHPSEKYKKELTNWLKSLRPQPKVEWSEEQKPVDLEEEIRKYLEPITYSDIRIEPFNSLEKCARHFYELGRKETVK